MPNIKNSLYPFIEAVKQKKNILLTPEGVWFLQNPAIAWVFPQKLSAKIQFIRHFIACLDRIEKIPVRFASRPGVFVSQVVDFHGYLLAAQAVKQRFSQEHHPDLRKQLNRLRQRVLALLYRLEEENSGLHKTDYNLELFQKLKTAANAWKAQQNIFWHTTLSDSDLRLLENACRYPEFIKLLFEDRELQHDFFFWTLRDGLDAGPYIEFPLNQSILTAKNMRGRIGRLGGDLLKVRKIGAENGWQYKEKVVTLPFEGREISLLDLDRKVTFRGNYTLTIGEIFQVFADKPKDAGNLEFFSQGITNWNANFLGWWNGDQKKFVVIDLDEPEWWRALPTMEVLTLEDAQKRYGAHLDGYNWNLSAKASREYINLHFDKTHAFLEMAIPDATGRRYTIYDFGKCAIKLPFTRWEKLKVWCLSVPATIVYPDENIFFSTRQHVGYSFELTPEEGNRYMASIREDMELARTGNMIYQLEGENCGKWIQVKLEEQLGAEKVPNLYRIALMHSEPIGLLANVFAFVRRLPLNLQTLFVKWSHLPWGSWKGQWVVEKNGQKVWRSLLHSTFLQDTVVYLPAYLHKQQEQGIFASDPERHKILMRGYFDAKTKMLVEPEDPFDALELFEDSA